MCGCHSPRIGSNTCLADAGHDVVVADSAEQALAVVQSAETAFDAVISDYRRPTLSGWRSLKACSNGGRARRRSFCPAIPSTRVSTPCQMLGSKC